MGIPNFSSDTVKINLRHCTNVFSNNRWTKAIMGRAGQIYDSGCLIFSVNLIISENEMSLQNSSILCQESESFSSLNHTKAKFSNQTISDNFCCRITNWNKCLPNTTLAKSLGCFEFSFHFQKWPQPAAERKIVFAWTYFELILRENFSAAGLFLCFHSTITFV